MATQLPSAPPLLRDSPKLFGALEGLEEVRRSLARRELRFGSVVADLPPDARPSARNLIHYLGLRAYDLEPVQRVLAAHGLSSLGHAESHVLANLDALLRVLRFLTGRADPPDRDEASPVTFEDGERLRRERAECVMLNKGPCLADAVRTLDDILSRMHRHQEKKRPLLAHLGVADHFFAPVPP